MWNSREMSTIPSIIAIKATCHTVCLSKPVFIETSTSYATYPIAPSYASYGAFVMVSTWASTYLIDADRDALGIQENGPAEKSDW
nr:hypothetical protein CFP56_77370 [Quercus suber]